MTTNTEIAQQLTALGFSDIEALVYCELLRAPNTTGYRIAHAIGKAPANTYQAIASLAAKGAVLIDEGESRNCRAVPPAEFLSRLSDDFKNRCQQASKALTAIEAPGADDRIYQLKNVGQVYERARSILDHAREIILFDLFPEPLDALRPALVEAATRGLTIAGMTYGDDELPGVINVKSNNAAFALTRWPGQQVTIIADAREFLVALLDRDGASVRHAIWSDSIYLACTQHNGMAAEIKIHAAATSASAKADDIGLLTFHPPGLHALVGSEPE